MNNFNWKQYINNYPDLLFSGINNQNDSLKHWIKYGKKEGRTDKPLIKKSTVNTLSVKSTVNTLSVKSTVNTDLLKLKEIQSNIRLIHGEFNMEIPEMLMSVTFLTGNEKVLEIGSNIGRNTFIIASILNSKNNNNFVTLECNPEIYEQLVTNKRNNNFKFFTENSALSSKYIFSKGWETICRDTPVAPDGYTKVNTIKYNELIRKYNINFDTLILDCEGSFYYILLDFPEILNNIKLIITENDYVDVNHLLSVTNTLLSKGFKNVYRKPLLLPNSIFSNTSKDRFFEVWTK
jgi:FkbM family methyltransferase